MNTKAQQIEELSTIIYKAVKHNLSYDFERYYTYDEIAEAVYNSGYRKFDEETQQYLNYIPELKKAFDRVYSTAVQEFAEKLKHDGVINVKQFDELLKDYEIKRR